MVAVVPGEPTGEAEMTEPADSHHTDPVAAIAIRDGKLANA
jgi:hypothetical protein